MAILKDLIVHGSSRFLNKIYASEIQTPLIKAEAGIIKKLKADDATVVGLLDVKGQLHTNSWSNSNIATIDGSFYITPTIGSASGTVSITSSSLVFSGTNYAVSSLYLGDGSSITWPQYSKVLVTGQILSNGEWIPLGTLLGQLSSTATAASISINNIKDNKNQTSNVLATLVSNGTTSSNYRNLKVSLYQRATSSTDFRPLGIYMTATGTNGRTFLDIYGGVESLSINNNYGGFAEPNVRIGNLQGLPSVGGQTPSGWGIYTDNGYFKGIIAADKGYIGSGSKYWVIANEEDVVSRSYIYNGTNSVTSTTEGVYLGTDGIRNYKDNTHNVTIKDGVISALGVDLSGKITANSGSIAGWTIKSTYLINSTTATAPGDNLLLLSPNGTSTRYTIAGQLLSGWTFTSGTTFGINKDGGVYATLGKIGGWNLNSDGFYITNSIPGYNANTLVFSKGTASTNAIGGSDTTSKNWMISAGTGFGVTTTGALYANDAHISGEITATSGTIGGIQIVNGNLNVSSISIGSLSGANNYAQKADVTQAIDNIQIGGRNYVKNSNVTLSGASGSIRGGTLSQMIPEGTIVTVSIQVDADNIVWDNSATWKRLGFEINFPKSTSGNQYVGVWAGSALSEAANIVKAFQGSFHGRISKTFVLQGDMIVTKYPNMYLQGISSGSAAVSKIKIEIGNKATDFTLAPEDTQENISNVSITANTALNQSVWYAECPTAAGTAVKIATISPVVTNFVLTKGVTVNVKFTNTNSATNSSLQLNVNGTGAKYIKYIYNGSYTNIVVGYLKANQMYQFRYDGTYWIVQMMYNSNNYDRSLYSLPLAASEVIAAGKIAVLGLNNKLIILKSTSFYIDCPPLYVGTTYEQTHVTNANTKTNNYTYWGTAFNLTSTHSIQNATANTNVYVVGTLSGDIFTPSTTVLTCAEPTTEDGLYYMLLGRMTSTTNAVLQAEHPIYVYTNGKFQKLEGTTATNFIQANSSGIFIHPAGTNADFTNNEAVGVQINSNSIDIYKPQTGTGSHLPIASYGQTTRIGLNNTSHFLIESGKLSAYSNNSDIYFETSGGSGQVQQKYVVPELPVTLTLSHEIETITSVEVDSVLTTNYSFEKGSTSVILNDRPITATTITITYTYTVAAVNDAGQEEISVQEIKNLDAVSTALSFNLQYNGTTIQSVSHTPYTLSSNNDIINIANRPSSGTVITIVFTLSNPNPYFTFNNRGIGLKGSGSVSFANEGIATGDSSFVIGTRNTASGKNSFSAGQQNVASAKSSFTLGEHLTANGIGSLITGRYNVANPSSLFTVGNGILNNSSNAFSVLESGDCIIAGRLLQGNGSSSRPIFRVKTEVYKAIGIGPGSGYSASRKIEKEGYVSIAILGFEAINNSRWTNSYADAGWCVIPRVWLGHSTTIDTPNQVVNSVTFYIWNQNSQKMVNVDFCVKILYISTSVL